MSAQSQRNVGGPKDERTAPDASQNASEKPPLNREKQPHNYQDIPVLGQKLLESLQHIQRDLVEEAIDNPNAN